MMIDTMIRKRMNNIMRTGRMVDYWVRGKPEKKQLVQLIMRLMIMSIKVMLRIRVMMIEIMRREGWSTIIVG